MATNDGVVTVITGQSTSLAPGAYVSVSVLPGGTLSLGTGTYYVDQFTILPGAIVQVNQTAGPILIYVSDALTYQSPFVSVGGVGTDLLLDYSGVLPVVVQAPFLGTLVALNAQVELTSVTGGHMGGFFANNLIVDPNTTVTLVPFSGTD